MSRRIDWANHANDFRRLIGTMWDLDEAVRAAVAFIERPDDDITWANTLLIVTADHGNSDDMYMRKKGEILRDEEGRAVERLVVRPGDEVRLNSKPQRRRPRTQSRSRSGPV